MDSPMPPLRPSEVRAVVRHRDGYRCTRCGMTAVEHLKHFGKTLDVHRVTPGSPYTVDGCVAVCRPCHGNLPKSPTGTIECRPGRRLVTFNLPPALDGAVRRYAVESATPLNAVVRLALTGYLQHQP